MITTRNTKINDILIVEDGYNSSYMTSLLIGLFYQNTNIVQILLNAEPFNINFIYFQEMVKHNFLDKIRKKMCIMSGCVNELRNFLFLNGFLNGYEIINECDVLYFYKFLLNNISNQTLLINDKEYQHIEFDMSMNSQENISVKSLLNTWLQKNTIYLKNDFQGSHIPQIVPLYINRNGKPIKIDINEKIKLSKNVNVKWIINSVICFKDGKYYVLFKTKSDNMNGSTYFDCQGGREGKNEENNWYLFDNNSIPSLKQVAMNDPVVIEKIKEDCVFIIYRYYY